LATNAGEVLMMFCAILVGWPAPLVAIQLLWINLVTDALPAMALGLEPPEPDVMNRPPRPPKEQVITPARGLRIIYHGALNAAAAGIAFYVIYRGNESHIPAARTAAFATLAFSQLLFSFACRSERYTLPQLGLLSNRWLIGAIAVSTLLQLLVLTVPFARPLFKVAPVPFAWEWLLVAVLAFVPVSIVEVTKLVQITSPKSPRR
jgi:Ca2+-transporting ATPase